MSNYNFPEVHFCVPGTRETPACGHYVDVHIGRTWREVTCGNCKRTKLYKDNIKEIAKEMGIEE